MAACFTEWTVLPHDPVIKHSTRVWTVTGKMPDGKTSRTMTVAKMADDRLMIHNPIALGESEMLELEAFGTPSIILVPNGYHRQDSKIWKDRFREAKVYTPEKSVGRVSQVVKIDGTYADVPKDDHVVVEYLAGTKNREGTVTVTDETGRTVVFCDMLCNVAPMKGFFGWLFAPTGAVGVPRISRMMILSDRTALAKKFEELAKAEDLVRLVPGHGRLITDNARQAVKRALTSFA